MKLYKYFYLVSLVREYCISAQSPVFLLSLHLSLNSKITVAGMSMDDVILLGNIVDRESLMF